MTRATTSLPITLRPLGAIDPRTISDEGALALASWNAHPIVARQNRSSDAYGLVGGIALALLLGGGTFWSLHNHREAKHLVASDPGLVVTPIVEPRERPIADPVPPLTAPPAPTAANPTTLAAAAPVAPSASAPIVVYDTGSTEQAPATPSTPAQAATASEGSSENELFASRVSDAGAQTAFAAPIANGSTTVSQGTLISAVLETAINTDLPGYARALVSKDVRSLDGTQILIPRSSRLIGQYKSGLSDGQSRVYIIWSRLIRPDGVAVALGSPTMDLEGQSGLAGTVDTHFGKRFGSALLLSVVGGLSAVGSASVVLSGGQSAASVAAQRDTQIAPTINVRPGQPIKVFTARDLNFTAASGKAQ